MKEIKELNNSLYTLVERMVKDPAHGIRHSIAVFTAMKEINTKLGYTYSDDILLTAALVHDLFTEHDRDNHHNEAGDFVAGLIPEYKEKYNFIDYYTKAEITLLENAVREHRASIVTRHKRSELSKILYLADKGSPDVINVIKRCIVSTSHTCNSNDIEKVYEKVKTHLTEKFCAGGYLYEDTFYADYYKDDVIVMQKTMKEMVDSKYILKLCIKHILEKDKK